MNYISDMSDFTFSRKLSIKGLFDAQSIYAQFGDLHFLSFAAFSKFMVAGMFKDAPASARSIQYYHIDVSTRDELEAILQIILATKLDTRFRLILHYTRELLPALQELITDQDIELSTDGDTLQYMIDNGIEIPGNPEQWVEYKITARNYADTYETLLKRWLKAPQYSLIDLTFDYASFEGMKLEELHALSFYIGMLRNWITKGSIQGSGQDGNPNSSSCCNTTGNGSIGLRQQSGSCSGDDCSCSDTSEAEAPLPSRTLAIRNRMNPLRCYIDDNLDIRLNKSTVFFPISQFFGKSGEDIPQKSLNIIRKIIDIKFETSLILNWYLVDLDQNFKVMGDHYRIPYITQLICSWLDQSIDSSSLIDHVKTLKTIQQTFH